MVGSMEAKGFIAFLTVEHQLENVLMGLSVWGCACRALPVQGHCCALCAHLERAACASPGLPSA